MWCWLFFYHPVCFCPPHDDLSREVFLPCCLLIHSPKSFRLNFTSSVSCSITRWSCNSLFCKFCSSSSAEFLLIGETKSFTHLYFLKIPCVSFEQGWVCSWPRIWPIKSCSILQITEFLFLKMYLGLQIHWKFTYMLSFDYIWNKKWFPPAACQGVDIPGCI